MYYMLTSNEQQIAHEWEKYRGYTVRPLPSTIAYYQHWIAHVKPPSSLIYGGTPEIRNLFQALAFHVVMIDKATEMVRAMGTLTRDGTPIAVNETFVNKNWLQAGSLNQQFDLVIGDDAINMVSWKEFDLFLQHTHQLLHDNGLFICHLLVQPDEKLINQSVDDVFKEYKRGDIPSIYDLASRLNFICYEQAFYRMGWQDSIRTIGKKKLDLFKPDLDFYHTFKYCNSQFYCPPQHAFETLVKRYFAIEEIFYPHEHQYCQFEPVYTLKKLPYAGDKHDEKNIARFC